MFEEDGQALYGRLATDRPHQAKAQFVYTAPFGLNVGVFQSVASGLPVSRCAVLAPGVGPVFYAGRGSDGRTPVLSQTDISVQYVLGLGGRRRLTVGLNVLNLFNQAQGVSRYSQETDVGVQLVVDEADYYAGRADVERGVRPAGPEARSAVPAIRVLPGTHQGTGDGPLRLLGLRPRSFRALAAPYVRRCFAKNAIVRSQASLADFSS